MDKTLLKKLHYRGQQPATVLDAPDAAQGLVRALGAGSKGVGKSAFHLAFALDAAAAVRHGREAAKRLESEGVFWVAYPKGSSKLYPRADLNRDRLHAALHDLGWDGVSLVALDADWSAIRFKPLARA